MRANWRFAVRANSRRRTGSGSKRLLISTVVPTGRAAGTRLVSSPLREYDSCAPTSWSATRVVTLNDPLTSAREARASPLRDKAQHWHDRKPFKEMKLRKQQPPAKRRAYRNPKECTAPMSSKAAILDVACLATSVAKLDGSTPAPANTQTTCPQRATHRNTTRHDCNSVESAMKSPRCQTAGYLNLPHRYQRLRCYPGHSP